jgi:hypothetical protein
MPLLRESPGSSIVVISSVAGKLSDGELDSAS